MELIRNDKLFKLFEEYLYGEEKEVLLILNIDVMGLHRRKDQRHLRVKFNSKTTEGTILNLIEKDLGHRLRMKFKDFDSIHPTRIKVWIEDYQPVVKLTDRVRGFFTQDWINPGVEMMPSFAEVEARLFQQHAEVQREMERRGLRVGIPREWLMRGIHDEVTVRVEENLTEQQLRDRRSRDLMQRSWGNRGHWQWSR